MKKMMSFVLVSVLCLSLCVPTSAKATESLYYDRAVTVLTAIHMPQNLIDTMEVISFQNEVFSFRIAQADYEMKCLANGTTEFIVTENQNKDSLIFDAAGNLLVLNETAISVLQANVIPEDVVMPRNSTTNYQKACPYGVPSDYNSLQYSESHNSLVFEKNFKKYTTMALSALLTSLVSGLAASFIIAMSYSLAQDLLAGEADGKEIALSNTVFYHKNGHSVPNFGNVRLVDCIVSHWVDEIHRETTTEVYKIHDIY